MDLEIYDRMVEEGKLTQTDEEKEKEERILLICACGHSKLWRDMPICDGTCKELVKVSE